MKTVLITGAGQRLGKVIATTLAQAGYSLILHYHTSKKETEKLGATLNAKIVQADLSQPSEVTALFKKMPHVDSIINTVGSFIYKPLSKTSSQEFESCIENNLFVAYRLAEQALPKMKKRKFGRIINFGSVGCDQVTARPLTTPYYIGKTGLLMLTKSLAQEYQNTGVTINMVTPGVLPTGVKPKEKVPIITFDDVARAVLFLLSTESQNFNGSNIEISGGWRPE